MPIITMATTEAAIFSRYARSAMIESMRLPSVKAAMMRGLPRTRIIWLHALPNAMLSILTIWFFSGYARGGRRDHRNGVLVAGRGQAFGAVRRQP